MNRRGFFFETVCTKCRKLDILTHSVLKVSTDGAVYFL